MFHKLKQKAILAGVNIDPNNEKNRARRQNREAGTLEPTTDKYTPAPRQASGLRNPTGAGTSHVSQEETLKIQLDRMVKWEQDALHRVRQADERRDRAIDRAEELACQLERSAHQVEILRAEIGRKDQAHLLEKQAIVQDRLDQIAFSAEVHVEEKERLEQNFRDMQSQKDADLLEQRGRLMLQIMDVQKRRDEELQNMRNLNQAQGEEIRTLRQSLRVEIMMRSKSLDGAIVEIGQEAKEGLGASISEALNDEDPEQRQSNALQEVEDEDAVLRSVCLELDTLKQITSDMESVISRSREEIEQQQRAKEVLQTELEEKTRALEERTLAWNRAKNELSEEKRNGRQILEDNVDKNRQLEFVQQQCARLKEGLSLR
ncbi:hypothetical protein IFR05_002747 [Cadophora sp. M221]|nr:hypothetical protein IFR05_002747 [Cadophora sp. M221]